MGAENTFLMAGGVVLLMCVADLGPLIWLGLFAAMYAHHTVLYFRRGSRV